MIKIFRKYIEDQKLFYRDEKILLAISGGIDSVVMLDLFNKLEMNCITAHCNFNLRGDESDADQTFVNQLAKKYGYQNYSIQFDTQNYAQKSGISIEMAARELRYKWFEKLRKNHNCKYIAVAHHSDDVIETLFINLCRGTGIRGIAGIKPKTGKIIRPLLNLSRPQLKKYARENKLEFREDSTNIKLDYVRNKIRHKIIPVLEEINPGIRNTLMENIHHFKEVEQIYNQSVEQKRKELVSIEKNSTKISIHGLSKLSSPATYLHEYLAPFGFHFRDIQHIALSLESTSGKCFYSPTHRLIRDREHLIISLIEKKELREYQINQFDYNLTEPLTLKIELVSRTKNFKITADNNIAYLDFQLLKFPLKLRKWKKGDSFHPLGMNGRKKLSDFFIDQKLSIDQKEKIWVLTSEKKIIWVVGHRINEHFKIMPKTKKICKIVLL